jgi:hypothetical protein
MPWNRSEYVPQMLKTASKIAGWIGVYLLGSYVYFSLTYDIVLRTPALLIPSLMPLSALSAWVSWKIENEIQRAHVEPSTRAAKASILPLLYMSVIYSSVVEGFLYEWCLHGDLRPVFRIGLDLLFLSPFFTDAAATYVYERLLGEDHQSATNYVGTRLPSFVVPLLGFWFVFSVAGNTISSPVLSFMVFDFGIIVWTAFFTWANQVDLPENLRTSPNRFLRRLGVLNDFLSRPLGRVYRSRLFGDYLMDLLILIFSLAVASELWLADVATATTLATIMAGTFAAWKTRDIWIGSYRLIDPNHLPIPAIEKHRHTTQWPIGMPLYSLEREPFPVEEAIQLVLNLNDPSTIQKSQVQAPGLQLQ